MTEFNTMFIRIGQSKSVDESQVGDPLQIGRNAHSIIGYELIRHDAATTKNGTASRGLILERIREVNAVFLQEFPFLKSMVDVHEILAVPIFIWFLDASTGWRIIARCGKPDG